MRLIAGPSAARCFRVSVPPLLGSLVLHYVDTAGQVFDTLMFPVTLFPLLF
ncbi:unnamed protein product [Ixodes persulcatus]